jgi:tRNA threonylcarbamoyladenosine biosynthesis protein TsaB
MLVVGIETSGPSGSIALQRDGTCLQSRSLDQPGRRHAQSLVLELKEMLSANQVRARDVDAIAVSRGPGSFTGLRVGIVCAKTYSYATGCRFVAVDTFSAVAMNCPANVQDVWIVEDAQRGDLFVRRYHRKIWWEPVTPLEIVSADDWLPQRTEVETITGRGLSGCDLASVKARCLTEEDIIRPSAASIAAIGEWMLQNPDQCDAAAFDFWKASPLYVRKSAAEEQRDKKSASVNG